jgi:acyl-CoA thioesterase
MLHLLPESTANATPLPYAEAVSRLASIRHAMRLVEPFGAGPASDLDDDIASAWDEAGEARQRCFDRRTGRLIGTAAAGLEALLSERQQGSAAHDEASKTLVDEIRRELRDVAGVILA